ncbi:MAG: hypothetical protein ACREV6_20385 [Clostridium sp.]|uniref:hypothetical protein n=1 Tax=Clostridium sp. TaxID=1506 RepID=UPI003D6D8CBF
MKKFAQIVGNRAHWIFEAEEKPDFASNIVLVEITGNEGIEGGWDYDEKTKTFSEHLEPIIFQPVDLAKVEMAELIIELSQKINELEAK